MLFDTSAFLRVGIAGLVDATSASASFATTTGDMLEVSAYADGAFRLRVGPTSRPDYGLVSGRTRSFTTLPAGANRWTLTNGDTALSIGGSPCTLTLSWRDGHVLASTTDRLPGGDTRLPCLGRAPRGGLWTAAFALESGAPVYGLGEKFGKLDKRGELVHSQVEDAQGVNTGQSWRNVPFAWSPGNGRGAWGTFVATPGMVTHGVGHPDWSHRSHALVVEDEALDLVLFAGDTPAALLAAFASLAGHAPALPRWSLGLWAAGGHDTSDAALATARRLRERRIPCDVVAMQAAALAAQESDPADDTTGTASPAPADTIAQLRALGFRTCVREHPHIPVQSRGFRELAQLGFLLRDAQGGPYAASWRSGTDAAVTTEVGLFDFTHDAAHAWWRDAHEALFATGACVIEATGGEYVPDGALARNGDRGRRLHNVYPLLQDRCIHDATARFGAQDDAPPIVWSRAGWTGSARHAIGAAGVAQSDWEGLAAVIRGALSWGMSGGPFAGQDVGGDGEGLDGELYARWLEAAVFASHVRLPRAPGREPWAFGAEVEAVCRKWLAFRYRLVPYLETCAASATTTGMPVMRAMPLAFPRNALLRAYDTQFMCGDALLVAPVLRPGGEIEVALPPGHWYDLNTRQRYAGRQILRYRATLDQFPVFGREGHVLPLGRAVQHTGEIDPAAPLELAWIFGKPAAPLAHFSQVAVQAARDGTPTLRVARGVRAEIFGDPAGIVIEEA